MALLILYKDKVKNSSFKRNSYQEGGDISYNLITYLQNFSREKLKLLTLKLNVTMKHLTNISSVFVGQ